MATRSRRSAARSDSLNPAMIHLYDTGRLRQELKQRGLDTTGNRNILADRLQEAVLSERNSRQTYSPPPQTEKSGKRGMKRFSKGNISSIDQVQMEAERSFLPHWVPEAVKINEDPTSISQAKVFPTLIEKMHPKVEFETEIMPSDKKNPELKIRIRSPKKNSPFIDKYQRAKHEKTIGNARELANDEHSNSSDDEELKWLNKTRREKRTRKVLFEERQATSVEDIFVNEKGQTESSSGKLLTDDKLHDRESEEDIDRSSKSSSMESGKFESVNSKEKLEKSSMQKSSIKLKFKTSLLKSSIERTLEMKKKETPSSLGEVSAKDGKSHSDATIVTSGQSEKLRLTSTPSISSSSEKTKEHVPRKKIPLRMQAPIDVLDSIFDKQVFIIVLKCVFYTYFVLQAQLLSSKYKTEQERALERQKLEMEKRRQNAASLTALSVTSSTALEKRRSVDFILPNRHPQELTIPQQETTLSVLSNNQQQSPRLASDFRSNPSFPLDVTLGSINMDEKRLLAQLPPPPLPPPLLSDPIKSPVSRSTSQSDNSVSAEHSLHDNIDETIMDHDVLSSNTPTVSCSTTLPLPTKTFPSTCLTHAEIMHSFEASTSSTSTKLDSERIKEMASALQAVFARLGSTSVVSQQVDTSEINLLSRTSDVTIDSDLSVAKETVVISSTEKSPNPIERSEVVENSSSNISPRRDISTDSTGAHDEAADLAHTVLLSSSSSNQELCSSLPSLTVTCSGDTTEESMQEDTVAYVDQIVALVVEELVSLTTSSNSPSCETHSGSMNKELTMGIEREELERKPDISEDLLRNPRRLLQKASDVLKSLHSLEKAAEQESADIFISEKQNLQQYEQLPLDEKYEDDHVEDKPLPDFHGEPVPDSDDDIIIEGVTRKRPIKKNLVQEEEPVPGDEQIEIDFYNADLNVKASETCQEVIDPDNGDGFALMWGGAKSTYGIRLAGNTAGFPAIIFQIRVWIFLKFYFRRISGAEFIHHHLQLLECLPIKHLPFEETDAHNVRVGWSIQSSANILGEAPYSYAYDLLAKKATNNLFSDYGEPCQVNDVITSCLDLASSKIHFWKNTEYLGVAFSHVDFDEDDVIFPHVCTKNYKLSVNYGDSQSEGWISMTELQKDKKFNIDSSLVYFSKLDRSLLVRGMIPPCSKNECTVLMMVGLPGVGKTTWVRQYLREHPKEQWTLLSTDTILSAMKVNGVPRSRGRWDMIMGLIAKALNRSLHLACRRRRNYIIDQTNISRETRRRKLTQFKDFQRKCVVIIPSEEEMISRQMKQSRMDGAGPIPVEAMLELKAMFSIPNVETEPIEDVFFVEPPLERIGDAIDLVARFNEEARPWCQKRRGRRGDLLRHNESRTGNNSSTRTFNGL
ncbi:unnamed protein product [Thelazia callipaeda]|uniref:SAP domain-containing protein n=1 Tax=Thelazia callipaeda TaxID=103827 RepID=A0A0N5CKU0_THECL|nr:unnamed protein product [Thelazia callipaeda]